MQHSVGIENPSCGDVEESAARKCSEGIRPSMLGKNLRRYESLESSHKMWKDSDRSQETECSETQVRKTDGEDNSEQVVDGSWRTMLKGKRDQVIDVVNIIEDSEGLYAMDDVVGTSGFEQDCGWIR